VAPRKYRPSAAINSAGHGQRPPDATPPEQHPLGSEPPASPPQQAAPDTKAEAEPAHFSSGLGEQLRQQRAYAERQANPIFAYLSQIPGLSAPKLQYLAAYFTAYPERFNQEHWNAVANAHTIATREHAEDSNEYFRRVNELLHRQHAVPPPPQAAPAPPPMHEPEPEPPPITHVEHDREPESEHMSSFVSAPVSRDGQGHAHAIEPEQSPHRVQLTAEERELCRDNKIDELEYAKGKLKLAKMKRSKLIE
jgi:hypothetical protein